MEEVPSWNLIATIPGLDEYITERQERKWKDQIVVLSSFYDAISVVPARAPGAENATGITALLHLAEVLKDNPPNYTVKFLATGSHFQSLKGVLDFLYKHSRESEFFRERMPDSEKVDFRLFVGLDLSSESDQIASFSHGTFNNNNWLTDNYLNNLLAPYADKFDAYLGACVPRRSPTRRCHCPRPNAPGKTSCRCDSDSTVRWSPSSGKRASPLQHPPRAGVWSTRQSTGWKI